MEHMQGCRNWRGLEREELSWVGGMGYPKPKNRLVAVLQQMFLVGHKGGNTKVKVPCVSTGSDIQ